MVNESYNKGRARRLHGAMHALNDDITAQVASGALAADTPRWRAWKRWIDNYGKWYGQVPSSFLGSALAGWGTSGIGSMLDSYEREMLEWREWYGKNFRSSASGVYNPAGTEAGIKPTVPGAGIPKKMPAWVWAGIAVVGVFAAASLVKGIRG